MTKKNSTYSEDSIERFAGLLGIRKRPTRFIGSNDSNGLFTIIREPLDNAVDLSLINQNNSANLIVDGDSFWIIDQGPGIPVGKKDFVDEQGRKEKMSTLYVVTGLTNAGKNFSGDNTSRGAHGEGLKCTNAMSSLFQVWTFRDKKWWTIQYKDAKLATNVTEAKAPKLPNGLKIMSGTAIKFVPDMSLFAKNTKLLENDVKSWCELTTTLLPGFTVKYTNVKGKTVTYACKGGVKEYLTKRKIELGCNILKDRPFHVSTKTFDVAIGFSDSDKATVDCYTNGLLNKDGGEHQRALFAALDKSLKPYKGKNIYTPSDIRDGLLGLVNAKLAIPKFNNQTKDKLLDDRAYDLIFTDLTKELDAFWKKNAIMAKEICVRAANLRSRTNDFLKDKKFLKTVKNAKQLLPAKLNDCRGNIPVEQRELIIVEGESAEGGLVPRKDHTRQALYCLKGKPLNVMDATKDKINNNIEIAGILAALGVGEKTNVLRYGKIIMCTDADDDGKHIRALLIAALYKFVPNLIKEGRLYFLDLPEYVARKGTTAFYGSSKEAVIKKAGSGKITISHFKGLGEMEPEDLETTVLSNETRRLVRLNWSSSKDRSNFERLMGKDTSYRKQVLGINRVDAGKDRK